MASFLRGERLLGVLPAIYPKLSPQLFKVSQVLISLAQEILVSGLRDFSVDGWVLYAGWLLLFGAWCLALLSFSAGRVSTPLVSALSVPNMFPLSLNIYALLGCCFKPLPDPCGWLDVNSF